MEIEKLEFKVVMDDGSDSEVLARVSHLDFGAAVYMAAVTKYPERNVYLRHRARIIKQNLGEPKPAERPPDPRWPDWEVGLIRGAKTDHKGIVMAPDEESAKKLAIERFKLNDYQVNRLVIKPRR